MTTARAFSRAERTEPSGLGDRADERPGLADRSGFADRDFEFTSADFARIRELIHRRAGISLSEHKREMAYSRLARRLRARGLDNFRRYLDLLEAENSP